MPNANEKARKYSRDHAERFRRELHELIRIPSLSADPAHADDVKRAADWLAEHLHAMGVESARVMPTAGHPVVYGEWTGAGPDKPTVLVYGHYDVVPAAMEDGWNTPPFEPVEKDGKIYARGATDDKGQLFIHVKALESYLEGAGGAPVNVKFLLEGEEEVSSPNLAPFIKANLDLLKADVCVISDSSMPSIEEPAITHSLRGMTYIEIDVQGPTDDLHSGFCGGAAHNPALALVEILAKLYNPDNTIAVPGFYDDVVTADRGRAGDDREERADRGAVQESHGRSGHLGRQELHHARARLRPPDARHQRHVERVLGARPQDHHSGQGGGQAELPSGRQPGPGQDLRAVEEAHRVDHAADREGDGQPADHGQAGADPLRPAGDAGRIARLRERVGAAPVFTRGGGSIPIVADIYDMMKIPVVMMGYGLDSDGLHAPNEHYSIEMFHRGIETAIVYLEELASLRRGADKEHALSAR